MLELHGDSAEALIDLSLELSDRLFLLSLQQCLAHLFLSLRQEQVLVAERALPEPELKTRLVHIDVVSLLDELFRTLGWK